MKKTLFAAGTVCIALLLAACSFNGTTTGTNAGNNGNKDFGGVLEP